jgi:hypothetical protein
MTLPASKFEKVIRQVNSPTPDLPVIELTDEELVLFPEYCAKQLTKGVGDTSHKYRIRFNELSEAREWAFRKGFYKFAGHLGLVRLKN